MTTLRNAGSELAQRIHDEPVHTDAEIVDLMGGLVGAAISRQLWFHLLDSEQRPIPALISIRDIPVEADSTALAPLVELIAAAAALEPGASVVIIWERPGTERLDDDEAMLVDALGSRLRAEGCRVRAQLLSHSDGLAML